MVFNLNNGFGTSGGQITGQTAWDNVTGKPEKFPPSEHRHAITDIDGLRDELDSRPTSFKTLAGQSILGAGNIPFPEAFNPQALQTLIDNLAARLESLEGGEVLEAPAGIGTIADRTYTAGQVVPATDLATKWTGATYYIISPNIPAAFIEGAELQFNTFAPLPQTAITVNAGNSRGLSTAPLTFNLTINAVAPTVIQPLPDRSLVAGAGSVSINLDEYFSGAATYALSPEGQGVTIDGRNLLVSAAAQRNIDVTVTATNSTGQSVSDAFAYAVTPPNVLAGTISPSPLKAGQSASVTFDLTPDAVFGSVPLTSSGDGVTWTFTAPQSGSVQITANKAGYQQFNQSYAVDAPITATLSPNPPAAGQPFTVTFSQVPDTSPGLTGTGLTRTGTAPASGNLVITATKAGYNPFSLTVATTPADAPTATGGSLTLSNGSVFLEQPTATGYPDPTVTLTTLTRNGTNVLGELTETGDEIPDAVKSTSSTYSATWTISNGVGTDVVVTKTLVVEAAGITATVEPTTTRLYAGQTPAAIPSIATYLDNANYSSGTAQLQVNDANATTDTVLAEGDVVSVLVTGSGNLFRRWTLSSVEYALQIFNKGVAGWSVNINDLIPDNTPVTLGWDGEETTTTRNAIKAGPVPHIEPTITQDGETLTINNPGPWINEYSAGAVQPVYRWRRNGAPIPGGTFKTYTLVAADAGTTLTGQVTAHNANNDGETGFTTNGIAIPAAETFEPYTALPGNYQFQATTANTSTWADLDIGAAHPDRDILVAAGHLGAVTTVSSVTIVAGGQTIPMTLVQAQASIAASPNTHLAVYHAKVPLGTTATITMTTTNNSVFRYIDYRRGIKNVVSGQASAGTAGSETTASVTITGATEGHKLLAFSARPGAANGIAWTGATEIYDLDPTGGTNRNISAAEGVVPSGGSATVSYLASGTTQSALIVIAAGA